MAKKQDSEMSMGDILLSIRKYVSEDNERGTAASQDDGQDYGEEIRLGADNEIIEHQSDPREFGEATNSDGCLAEENKREGPFDKLTEALRSYGKSGEKNHQTSGVYGGDAAATAVHQLFVSVASDLVNHWIKQNLMDITEELVKREIERLKS
jgi:cell pole-organizing protein PopZ